MATLNFLIAAATAIIAVTAFANATFGGRIVMKAEGDGGSNPGGNDDLGWGNGDDDLPF